MPVIDLDFYDRVVLDSRALGQQAVARFVLWPNYRLLQRVKIVFEGFERAPPPGVTDVILAPNHTDRFNYWPLQWEMWRRRHPFTSVWVKGKYYRHPASATFFNLMGCIPLPSLGYLIEETYRLDHGRLPGRRVYREIRDVVDGRLAPEDPSLGDDARRVVCGKLAGPGGEALAYPEALRRNFKALMARAVAYTDAACGQGGRRLMVFPEGTRSVRLGVGRTGIIEYALATGRRILPIGCNGSDLLYPGNLPFARSGTVVYRFGEPYDPRSLVRPEDGLGPYTPFTEEAAPHRALFERLTEDLMRRIHALLDERHRSERYAAPAAR